MRRSHRRAHQAIWLVLTVLVAIGFTMALAKRKPPKKKKAEAPVAQLASAAHLETFFSNTDGSQ